MPGVAADPSVLHPMPDQPRVVLLKPLVTSPLIEVGEFSYSASPTSPSLHLTTARREALAPIGSPSIATTSTTTRSDIG
jgi:hypothetical protein